MALCLHSLPPQEVDRARDILSSLVASSAKAGAVPSNVVAGS